MDLLEPAGVGGSADCVTFLLSACWKQSGVSDISSPLLFHSLLEQQMHDAQLNAEAGQSLLCVSFAAGLSWGMPSFSYVPIASVINFKSFETFLFSLNETKSCFPFMGNIKLFKYPAIGNCVTLVAALSRSYLHDRHEM